MRSDGKVGKTGVRYVWSDFHPECFPIVSPMLFECLTTPQKPIGSCQITWGRKARHVFAGVCRARLNKVSTGVELSPRAHVPLVLKRAKQL
jgi:hypothetical protein